jgi:hypothetical protein
MSLISINTQYDSRYTYFKGDYRMTDDGDNFFFVVTIYETEFEKYIESVEWIDGAAPEVSDEENEKILEQIGDEATIKLI